MSLEQKDLEIIEHLIYKNADDIAISIARSFERLEERVDSMESRLYSRLSELEDRIEAGRQDTADTFGEIRDEMREIFRRREALELD